MAERWQILVGGSNGEAGVGNGGATDQGSNPTRAHHLRFSLAGSGIRIRARKL